MRVPIWQVDAFASEPFGGNPAAVCMLDQWLPDPLLQAIAAENNLSETAFVVRGENGYELRWMTPTVEVDLCGHATLAAGFVLLREWERDSGRVRFATRSGPVEVLRDDDRYVLDFPSRPPEPCEAPERLAETLGGEPQEVQHAAGNHLALFADTQQVADLRPDFVLMMALPSFGVIATAPGDDVDFVSRYFAPKAGVPEDPVTGSTHTTLTPYWARKLDKPKLRARQISRRGGELFLEDCGERVRIGGYAALYLEGSIEIG
ncbi:MAG: PhzF family phenazine biosynthesis protein [Deltaproteobacteria bacterium]|nr:PhzF family phenazine biosynthesis protein [Deltaproteobacteria bacterium]